MVARPRAIQGDVETALLEALADCPAIALACQSVGIAPSVYYDEVLRNPEFAEKAHRARARKAVASLKAIHDAGADDWRAHQAYLQLAHPEHFSRQRLEVSGPGGSPLTVAHAEVSPDLVAGALRILGEGGGSATPESGAEPVHPAPAD